MTPHEWIKEAVDGGHLGTDVFWVCQRCKAYGGGTWNIFSGNIFSREKIGPHRPFLPGPALPLSDDCDEALQQIEKYKASQVPHAWAVPLIARAQTALEAAGFSCHLTVEDQNPKLHVSWKDGAPLWASILLYKAVIVVYPLMQQALREGVLSLGCRGSGISEKLQKTFRPTDLTIDEIINDIKLFRVFGEKVRTYKPYQPSIRNHPKR